MKVLVVDDEAAVRESICRSLRFEGYEVESAENGVQALDSAMVSHPDVIVLDVMMPVLDGVEACRRLRAAGDRIPVLMLTARRGIGDRVGGLDAGADDYLVKPFELEELLARLRALLRRAALDSGSVLRFGDLVLDLEVLTAHRNGRSIELTRTEGELLATLMRHPRRVVARSQLFTEVWGFDFGTRSNSLDVYIGYLRRKLEAEGGSRLVHTVRGIGYILREAYTS
ncbi:MAG: response regulator transcription factor [Sciscionella sp.]